MLKALILAMLVMMVVLIFMRRSPAVKARLNNFLRHPFVRSVLIQGLLRLLRFLIFRR